MGCQKYGPVFGPFFKEGTHTNHVPKKGGPIFDPPTVPNSVQIEPILQGDHYPWIAQEVSALANTYQALLSKALIRMYNIAIAYVLNDIRDVQQFALAPYKAKPSQ